jgi:Zn-dependent protease with chaperone function
MADPVKPDDPPRRIVDENLSLRRTDPRMRVQPAVSAEAPPIMGLPGQPPPRSVQALQSETGEVDDLPTIADVPMSQVRPHAPPMPPSVPMSSTSSAPPPPASTSTSPLPPRDGGRTARRAASGLQVVPATREPEPSGPVRPATASRTPTASLDPVAPLRPATSPRVSLDPPVEPVRPATSPRVPVVGSLDPPVEPVRPATSPRVPVVGSLDPPVEPLRPATSPRVPVVGSLDPPVEPMRPATSPRMPVMGPLDPALPPMGGSSKSTTSGRVPVASLDPPMEPARKRNSTEVPAATKTESPSTSTKTKPPWTAIGAAAAVVVVVALFARGGSSGSALFNTSELRQLADIWLAHSAAPWGGTRADDDVTRAVSQLGTKIATALELNDTPRFVVLNDEVAAHVFTLPDNTVAVTVGALRRLGNEAQLAAVLAHALAHAKRGDVVRRLDAGAGADAMGAALERNEASNAVIEFSALAVTTPNVTAAEIAADKAALRALEEAGYSPAALADAIRNFGVRGGGRRAAWLHQHPDGGGRFEALSSAKSEGSTGEREYATRILDKIGRVPAQRGQTARATTTPSTTTPATTTSATTTPATTTPSTTPSTTTPKAPPTTAP